MLLTWALLICSAGLAVSARGRQVIRFDSWTIEPFGEAKRVSYDNNAPANLRHTFKVKSRPSGEYPGAKTAVQVTCKKISLPPKVNGQCKFGFMVYDGEKIHKYCGERENIKITTENDDIHLLVTSGPNGGGVVDCVAQGVFKGSGISISVGSEPVDPGRFPKPSFFTENSQEIDSSEHGQTPGEKKTTCECGLANKAKSRIVQGKITGENEFPWMAALIEKDSGKQLCGATIVSPYHAVTAAHCTDMSLKTNTKLALIVGAHDLKDVEGSDSAETINVARVIQHNQFDWKIVEQDIALLVLEKEIKFSREVSRICLPKQRVNLNNQYAKVIGWGKLRTDGSSASLLRKLDVRVMPIQTCGQQWPQLRVQGSTQLCTYAYMKASCSGDSGGPLAWVDPETNRYTLVGIISYGNSWCGDMYPSVNTEVGAFINWLNNNIRDSMPGAETCTKE